MHPRRFFHPHHRRGASTGPFKEDFNTRADALEDTDSATAASCHTHTQKHTYTPGETILLHCELKNRSEGRGGTKLFIFLNSNAAELQTLQKGLSM